MRAQRCAQLPDILHQGCWWALLTSCVQHMEATTHNVTVTVSRQVQLHGTQNTTSHWNLPPLMRPRRRGVNCLCCVSQHARSLAWGNKKSWEAFSSVKMMTLLQRDQFCKLHGSFDVRKHFSRGKDLNRSDKTNRGEYLNHSSILILNCWGEKGELSRTVLGSVTEGKPIAWPGEKICWL